MERWSEIRGKRNKEMERGGLDLAYRILGTELNEGRGGGDGKRELRFG